MPRQIASLTLTDARHLLAAAEKAQSGRPLFGIDSTNRDKVVIFGGGIPIKSGDMVIGAVGASGDTP